ncbi:MAG: hypothetical protein QNJ73_06570 [Gammaproteobacteria bacterium]|nr:hypothetical protein [Gammaproteobacteria bacterium]
MEGRRSHAAANREAEARVTGVRHGGPPELDKAVARVACAGNRQATDIEPDRSEQFARINAVMRLEGFRQQPRAADQIGMHDDSGPRVGRVSFRADLN